MDHFMTSYDDDDEDDDDDDDDIDIDIDIDNMRTHIIYIHILIHFVHTYAKYNTSILICWCLSNLGSGSQEKSSNDGQVYRGLKPP